jgi:hypothetical protein
VEGKGPRRRRKQYHIKLIKEKMKLELGEDVGILIPEDCLIGKFQERTISDKIKPSHGEFYYTVQTNCYRHFQYRY